MLCFEKKLDKRENNIGSRFLRQLPLCLMNKIDGEMCSRVQSSAMLDVNLALVKARLSDTIATWKANAKAIEYKDERISAYLAADFLFECEQTVHKYWQKFEDRKIAISSGDGAPEAKCMQLNNDFERIFDDAMDHMRCALSRMLMLNEGSAADKRSEKSREKIFEDMPNCLAYRIAEADRAHFAASLEADLLKMPLTVAFANLRKVSD